MSFDAVPRIPTVSSGWALEGAMGEGHCGQGGPTVWWPRRTTGWLLGELGGWWPTGSLAVRGLVGHPAGWLDGCIAGGGRISGSGLAGAWVDSWGWAGWLVGWLLVWPVGRLIAWLGHRLDGWLASRPTVRLPVQLSVCLSGQLSSCLVVSQLTQGLASWPGQPWPRGQPHPGMSRPNSRCCPLPSVGSPAVGRGRARCG